MALPLRVILDTNLWSEIGVRGASRAFDEFARRARWRVVVPPTVLLEVARDGNPERRRAGLSAITRSKRGHTPTEASATGAELLAAIADLRPRWRNPNPVKAPVLELERFWRTRVWATAKHDPETLYRRSALTDEAWVRTRYLADQERSLDLAGDARQRVDARHLTVDPHKSHGVGEAIVGVEPGEVVEAWRWVSASYYFSALVPPTFGKVVGRDTAAADWVVPFVKLAAVKADREDYNRFWYRDVSASQMPRNWIQGLCFFLQLKYSVGSGNPGDSQLATHVFDCDILLTADKRFKLLLEDFRRASPVPFAAVERVLIEPDDIIQEIERASAASGAAN